MSGPPDLPRFAGQAAVLLLVAAAAVFFGTEQVARPWRVAGPSMEPTLRPGDRVLVDLWSYRVRPPRPGEIVVLARGSAAPESLVKRVASVQRRGADGRAVLWLRGDNPASSLDSRSFGAIPADRARGRVFLRYWPPSRIGLPSGRPPPAVALPER